MELSESDYHNFVGAGAAAATFKRDGSPCRGMKDRFATPNKWRNRFTANGVLAAVVLVFHTPYTFAGAVAALVAE